MFIYLTNEALKAEGTIYGDFVRRNFLRSILGQRVMLEAGNEHALLCTETTRRRDKRAKPGLISLKSFMEDFNNHLSKALCQSQWDKGPIAFTQAHSPVPRSSLRLQDLDTKGRKKVRKRNSGPYSNSSSESCCTCQPEMGNGHPEDGVRAGQVNRTM